MTDAPKDNVKDTKSDSSTLQVRKIGNSIGFILPKETAVRLDLKEGDQLFLVDQPDGSLALTRRDPDFEKAMEIARRGMRRYHNALAELAK
jgi:putative addiction module antidote